MTHVKDSSLDDKLFSKIKDYYTNNPDAYEQAVSIIQSTSKVSLRLVYWFITKHAKGNKTIFTLNTPLHKLHADYKKWLKIHKNVNFDPFSRVNKVKKTVKFTFMDITQTTLGQLNFFRWATTYNVIQYIIDNHDDLCISMNLANRISKTNVQHTSNINPLTLLKTQLLK